MTIGAFEKVLIHARQSREEPGIQQGHGAPGQGRSLPLGGQGTLAGEALAPGLLESGQNFSVELARQGGDGAAAPVSELRMFEVGVTAIGILDTKDSTGQKLPAPGYSFFISVSAEFAPIQLGYGFTLNGVGGIAGPLTRLSKKSIAAVMPHVIATADLVSARLGYRDRTQA